MDNRRKEKRWNSKNDNFNKACQLRKAGNFRQAIYEFNHCNSPQAFETLFQIAGCHLGLDELEMSLSFLKKAEKKAKTEIEKIKIYDALANIYLALFKKEGNQSYLIYMKEMIDKHPRQECPQLLIYLAKYFYNTNQNILAKNVLQQVIENPLSDDNVLYLAGLLENRINRSERKKLTKEEAQKILETCNKLTVNISALLLISMEYPKLIDLSKTPVRHNNTIESCLREASLYECLDLFDKAEVIYKQILIKNPQHWKCRVMYAFLLKDLDGYKTQEEKYKDVIEMLLPVINATNPPPSNDVLLKAYHQLTSAYFDKFDYVNALKYTLQGLTIDPEDAVLLSMQGKISHPNSNKARQSFDEARVADERRFARRHPLPKEEKPKVFLKEELPYQHEPIQPADYSTSAKLQYTMKKHKEKKKTDCKKPIPEEVPSYDGVIEFVTHLNKELFTPGTEQTFAPREVQQRQVAPFKTKAIKMKRSVPVEKNDIGDVNPSTKNDNQSAKKSCACNRFTLFATAAAVTTTMILGVTAMALKSAMS